MREHKHPIVFSESSHSWYYHLYLLYHTILVFSMCNKSTQTGILGRNLRKKRRVIRLESAAWTAGISMCVHRSHHDPYGDEQPEEMVKRKRSKKTLPVRSFATHKSIYCLLFKLSTEIPITVFIVPKEIAAFKMCYATLHLFTKCRLPPIPDIATEARPIGKKYRRELIGLAPGLLLG